LRHLDIETFGYIDFKAVPEPVEGPLYKLRDRN